MREVRCPGCGRLLAVERDDGSIEAKTSRLVVVTERAVLSCVQCGGKVQVGGTGQQDCLSSVPAHTLGHLSRSKGKVTKEKPVDKKKTSR